MNFIELFLREDVLLSTRLQVGADVLCGLGVLAALVSILFHWRPSADGTRPSETVSRDAGASDGGVTPDAP